MIDKDTLLYGSFAKQAGSKGCKFFNTAFQKLAINAIYKSFSVDDISLAIQAMKTLRMKAVAITMPFKREVLEYVDSVSEDVEMIGASNTIINNDGVLHAENTDWMSVKDMLESKQVKNLTILGNGGYADAVKYACKLLDISTTSITRSNWQEIESLKDITVFNCTPVENIAIDESIDFINCLTWTETGAALASAQSKYQFKIYTGKDYID